MQGSPEDWHTDLPVHWYADKRLLLHGFFEVFRRRRTHRHRTDPCGRHRIKYSDWKVEDHVTVAKRAVHAVIRR